MKPLPIASIRFVFLLLAAFGLCATAFAAPATPGTETKKTETPAEKIKKALDQTTDLEITDQPLHLAVNQLREQSKINFVLDRGALAMMGLDPEQMPVNVKLEKVKLRSGLRTFLAPVGLTFAVVGDAVVITTEDVAIYRQLRQRVNVDVNRVQFADALKDLARETCTNLILDTRAHKESQAPVTLQVDDVPLDTAVRLMCEMAGLKPVRMGNVLFVTSKASAAELRQEPDLFPAAQPNVGEGVPFLPGLGGPGGFPGGLGGIAVPRVGIAPAIPPAPPVEEKPAKPDEKKPGEGAPGQLPVKDDR
jgi:hypothetical protein